MKSLFMTLVLVLMLILLIGSGYLIYEEEAFILQSRASNDVVSSDNSLAVSTPTCVIADGQEVTRLQVYCLNGRGLGEPSVPVSVTPSNSALQLQIQTIQGTTDDTGKAIYDIRSQTDGIFELTIKCGDILVKNNHRVCFTKS